MNSARYRGNPAVPSASWALLQAARSFLFVPGDRSERFEKAAGAGADAVIIDLEDAVGAEDKMMARAAAVTWLSKGGQACVRVNASDTTEFDEDVKALSGVETLLGVVLPKAADPAIASFVAMRTCAPVIALVESAVGLVAARSLAKAEGVVRLAFGHLDYAVDLDSASDRTAMLHARSELVLASRAAGLVGPIDGVTVDVDDSEVLINDLVYSRNLGMTAKLLIHPRQVEATHSAYQPAALEVSWALRVLDAARDGHGGVVLLDGQMVDAPVIIRAQSILRRRDRDNG